MLHMVSNKREMRRFAAGLAFIGLMAGAGACLAAPQWSTSLENALESAKGDGRPVLLDFQAPWCYSCYFMEGHVLNRQSFAEAARNLILLRVDVDEEEGRALKEKYRVTFLPTYIVVNAAGKALGRIVGEQAEPDFISKLKDITASGAGSPEDAEVASLRAKLSAADYDDAAGELAALEPALAKRLSARKDWKILSARLSLMKAANGKGKDVGPALASLKELLELEDSCDLAYDVLFGEKLLESIPAERRRMWLEIERKPLESLVNGRALKGGCADFRSPVEALGGVYQGLALEPDALGLYARAVAYLEGLGVKVGEDRNRDDNLRFFLELEKADDKLRTFYDRLVEAYGLDYVYPYRYAKYLEQQGKPGEALPWIEKADRLCYGANRFTVTKTRAKILAALGRKTEARAILDRDVRVGEKPFPKEAAELRGILEELSR